MTLFLKLAVSIFLSIQAAYAEEKVYIVGVEDYIRYPFQSVQNDKFIGKFRVIFDDFAKAEGIKFIYKPYKLTELYKEFYAGTLDFKFPDNPVWRSPEKVKYKILYSDFITHYIEGIFVKKSDLNKTIKEIKIFGAVDDTLPFVISKKENKGKIVIDKSPSCAELISKLQNDEIEAILCNYDVMQYLLKGSLIENEIVFNADLPFIDNYLYISTIKHNDIIEKFNNWIRKNREYIECETHEQF